MLKVTKWNPLKAILSNGLAETGTPAIGKFEDGMITLQDGRRLPVIQDCYTNMVYSGKIVKYYPQEHTMEESEYRGNKVIKLERNYSIDPVVQFDGPQIISKTHYLATVENRKTRVKLWYDPIPHAHEVFIRLRTLFVDSPSTFRPINEISLGMYGSDDYIRVNWSGGGYGEKFYVSGVELKEKFFDYYIGSYLTEEFKNHLKYKPSSMIDPWGGGAANDWMKIISQPSSWDIDVESIPYEGGYQPTRFSITKSALSMINEDLKNLFQSFKGNIRKDWKSLTL